MGCTSWRLTLVSTSVDTMSVFRLTIQPANLRTTRVQECLDGSAHTDPFLDCDLPFFIFQHNKSQVWHAFVSLMALTFIIVRSTVQGWEAPTSGVLIFLAPTSGVLPRNIRNSRQLWPDLFTVRPQPWRRWSTFREPSKILVQKRAKSGSARRFPCVDRQILGRAAPTFREGKVFNPFGAKQTLATQNYYEKSCFLFCHV